MCYYGLYGVHVINTLTFMFNSQSSIIMYETELDKHFIIAKNYYYTNGKCQS